MKHIFFSFYRFEDHSIPRMKFRWCHADILNDFIHHIFNGIQFFRPYTLLWKMIILIVYNFWFLIFDFRCCWWFHWTNASKSPCCAVCLVLHLQGLHMNNETSLERESMVTKPDSFGLWFVIVPNWPFQFILRDLCLWRLNRFSINIQCATVYSKVVCIASDFFIVRC